jgi:hypothetical protein
MFLKQSKEYLEKDQRNERRIQLWKGAVDIVKSMAAAHTGPGFEDCGWRGDHRDIAAVANYLENMNPENLQDQVTEAAAWINSERRTAEGFRETGRPVVHELLNHLHRKFPNG